MEPGNIIKIKIKMLSLNVIIDFQKCVEVTVIFDQKDCPQI